MNIKIRVKNEEHSKAIQERLFDLGYKWGLRGKELYFTDMRFLFADDGYSKDITYVDDKEYFETHKNKEVTLDDLYDMSEVREHTMEELTKILGYEFKIIK